MNLNKKIKICFSAGEVSGDFNASLVFKKIKEIAKSRSIDIEGFGLGGRFLQNDGVEIFADLTHRSSIGVFESIPYIFDRLYIAKDFLKKVEQIKPDIFIFVDNQGFNIPLSKAIKKLDPKIKTIYYFPPHISIWGKWNGKKLQKCIDYFITPFYEDYLEYKKINDKNVYFFGHPFFDEEYLNIKFKEEPEIIYNGSNLEIFHNKEENNFYLIDAKNKKKIDYIFLMPGSRDQEIKNLLPLFLKVADYLYSKYNLYSIIPLSNEKFLGKITKVVNNRENIIILSKNNYNLFRNAKFSIMSSGTATLEALILNVPMAICYKISKITFFLGKFIVDTKWVGMANILSKKEIAKEFLQDDFNFENIINYVEKFILDQNLYNEKKNEMKDILNNLKSEYGGEVLKNIANFILNL